MIFIFLISYPMIERDRISDEEAERKIGRPFRNALEGQAHPGGRHDVSRAPASFHPSEAAWAHAEQQRAIENMRARFAGEAAAAAK